MSDSAGIVSRLLSNLDDPNAFYHSFESLITEKIDSEPLIFYRPDPVIDVPFGDPENIKPKLLSGDVPIPSQVDSEALFYREQGLVDDSYSMFHLKSNETWFGAVESDTQLEWLEDQQDLLYEIFNAMVTTSRSHKEATVGDFVQEVQDFLLSRESYQQFTNALLELISEHLDVEEIGFYSATTTNYTLQTSLGFDPEETVDRQFFPREQLRQMNMNDNAYVYEENQNSETINLFVPINLKGHQEGLLVFFNFTPRNMPLSHYGKSKVQSLQSAMSLVLGAGRSIFHDDNNFIVDELSTLKTSHFFLNRLEQEIERGDRYDTNLSVLVLEIENLKSIKKEYGDSAELEAVRKLAQLIKNCFRMVDIACRFENNQFGIIYPNTSMQGAMTAVERFDQLVEDPFLTIGETEVPITVNGGLSSYPEDGEKSKTLIKQARLALYEAKQSDEATLKTSHELEDDETTETAER